ncbi:MAG: energy transducer TonB, partial [Bacteroidota bacterium]
MKISTAILLFFLAPVCLTAQASATSAEIETTDVESVALNMDEVRRAIGYPLDAANKGIQGQVVIRILVDTTGSVKDYKVLEEVHPILLKAVVAKVDLIKFSPAMVKGKLIPFW